MKRKVFIFLSLLTFIGSIIFWLPPIKVASINDNNPPIKDQVLKDNQNKSEEKVQTINYAPFLYYENYDYIGSGNEFAGFKVVLQYPLNEEGIYQFRRDGAGTSIAFVYQLTPEGIIELSYFPETYDNTDFRDHPDTFDDSTSLIMPLELGVGDTFFSGYQEEQEYEVINILDDFTVNQVTYHDVLVLSLKQDTNDTTQYFYYAPQYGLIYDEFAFKDEFSMYITNELKSVQNKMYYPKVKFKQFFKE
ncbi:MAG TPA: hypothetical protein K8V19_01275 [Globicatella sulfidifaciens]|uniref:Uncharacterized protein n=1 Tax=Globicatella sulfidifaciens DSM 15739 TaxID=1121925 RepID=A0A1T4K389_9LACT|nr:hypothetical protein [Globicatella sulfidifaciens]SJZ36785.1 hypothetical protein SAMN02746011_00544 [Globicatella sulfidifaciens DSM 15739]HJF16250.1 hypothetical protein [Globicatella sulfidifaciens]